MIKKITLGEIDIISSLSETLNLKETSSNLCVTYNSLFQALKRLESKLGGEIFLKEQNNKLQINPKYEDVIRYCRQIASSYKGIENSLLNRSVTQEIVITTSQTIIEAFFVDYYHEIVERFPLLSLSLIQDDSFSISSPVYNQIIMTTKVREDRDKCLYIPFHDFRQYLWASKSFIDKYGPINTIEDLHNLPVLFQKGEKTGEDSKSTRELVGFRGIFNHILAQNVNLKRLNISGIRTIDLLCEKNIAMMAASKETTLLNKLSVEQVLPEISGDNVTLYLKVLHDTYNNVKEAKNIIDWVLKCRDRSLASINIKPAYK